MIETIDNNVETISLEGHISIYGNVHNSDLSEGLTISMETRVIMATLFTNILIRTFWQDLDGDLHSFHKLINSQT